MNFIPAERFLELNEEVQKIILDWWKPQAGDLYCTRSNYDVIDVVINTIKNRVYGLEKDFLGYSNPIGFNLIPLLQMHQLIQFIEDKTESKLSLHCYYGQDYDISLFKDNQIREFQDLSEYKLQALFQVAVKIAEQEVKENERD